jgi:hypothetical protein
LLSWVRRTTKGEGYVNWTTLRRLKVLIVILARLNVVEQGAKRQTLDGGENDCFG